MGTHSYRYLDGRISFREWRFYIPKVVTLLAYNLYKICIIFKYGIRFAELPFASFISFITLYASVGQWPKLGVLTVMILTGIELTILVLICFDIFKTMRALREAKYTDHRTQILGFRFFLHQQLIFNVVYISTYLLILFALPNGSQVTQLFVRSESTEKLDGRGSYFDAQYLPFGLLLCVLAFATTEAYTNLPADVNLRQLFFSCTFRTDDEQEPLLEPVVYRNREPRSFTGQYIDIRPNCFVMQTNIELFNLSWFVYYHGTKKENSLKLDFKEISLKIRDYLYDQDTDTRVIIAESSDRIIFAFKGTSSTQNLFTDMKVIHNSLAQVVEHGSGRVLHENNNRFELLRKSLVYRRAKVHAGFEEAYCTIKERLRVITTKLLAENNRPFFFTGHSLGGALATLSSLDISLTLDIPPSRIAVSTFGSPRVGNKAFQELYDSEIKMNWRVVAGGDLISRLPKIGYRHVGKKVILTSTGELFIDPSALEMVFWHSQSASIVHHRKACYLLALRAWCNSLGGDYVPKFWPFPVSKNDSRKFDTTFKKPLSQGFSQHTFGRRRNNKDHGAKMQLFSDAIDALKDNITEPSENSIVLWSKLVKLALQENNEDDSKQ